MWFCFVCFCCVLFCVLLFFLIAVLLAVLEFENGSHEEELLLFSLSLRGNFRMVGQALAQRIAVFARKCVVHGDIGRIPKIGLTKKVGESRHWRSSSSHVAKLMPMHRLKLTNEVFMFRAVLRLSIQEPYLWAFSLNAAKFSRDLRVLSRVP